MRLRAMVLAAVLVLTGTATPARAEAGVAANCHGELVASHPLVDRDGVGARTGLGEVRVDVYQADAQGGTTCVTTVAGDGMDAEPVPMLAMLVTSDGAAAQDRGAFQHHAAVWATGTAGSCLVVHGAAQLRSFGPSAPASAGDWYVLPGADRRVCV